MAPSEPWEVVARPGSSSLDWYDVRTYEYFSLLTGLDFSERTLRPLKPVAPLRDWPTDLSTGARERLESWSDDTSFGKSWLDVSDFDAYDWDATVTWSFMASPPPEVAVTDQVIAEVNAYLDKNRQLPPGWGRAGWSRDGFKTSVETSPREQARQFLDVVQDMKSLAGDNPKGVRCVFEFTQ